MSKYQNNLAERLHSRFSADEVIGSVDELGWAGRYDSVGVPGGAILEEDTLGFVTIDVYKEDHELRMAWEDRISRLDNERDEPDEEDFVIQCDARGYAVTPLGEHFNSMDDAYLAVHEEMTSHGFFPNVWLVSDHGNFHKVTDFAEEVLRIQQGSQE